MTKHDFARFRSYLSQRPALLRAADLFATRVVYLYLVLPFLLPWTERGRAYMVLAGASLALSWGLLVQGIAVLFPRKRPYQAYAFTPLAGSGLFSQVDTRYDSFPSGHTTALATLSLVALFLCWPLGLVSTFITLVTAICRVLLGYHYAIDVIGGTLLALITVLGLHFFGVFKLLLTFVQ